MSFRTQRWVIGAGLCLLLVALRFPWLEADVGSPGIWPFGAFSSDEGEYTGGGRLNFLTGQWLDLEMGYPSTLAYAPAMHLLSSIGYRVCGLSLAATRTPTACAAVIAWLLVFLMTSRTTTPWLAGVLTLVISCNPISLTYERWGSSDVVFAAEIVAAWWLLQRPSPWRATATGLVAGFAILTKTTAIVFIPFLLAGVLMRSRRKTVSASGFAFGLAATLAAGLLWLKACVANASSGTLNLVEFPRTQSLLNFDAFDILRALAVFPRPTTTMLLGPFVFWLMLLPAWYLAITWWRTGRPFTSRTMMCAALVFYVGVMATQARNPVRYFLPLLYFAPLLLVYGRQMLFRTNPRPLLTKITLLAAYLMMVVVFWRSAGFPSDGIAYVLCNAYVLPKQLTWIISWPVLLTNVALLTVVAGLLLGWRGGWRRWLFIGTFAASTASILVSGYGYIALGASRGFVANQLLLQFGVIAGFSIVLAGRQQIRWPYWYGFAVLLFVGAILFSPCWRLAYPTLLMRQYTVRSAAAQVAARLPSDAVVIGRRASTLLQHTRMRLGLFTLCSSGKNDAGALTERLARLIRTAPQGAVYWLIAEDELPFYVSPEAKEICRLFRTELVETVFVPADRTPTPALLFVIKLQARPGIMSIPGKANAPGTQVTNPRL